MRSNMLPTILSVVSGKGGVGKSVISFNLAERFASLGVKTLIIDLDLFSGNLHLLANVTPRFGIEQYLAGELVLSRSITTIAPNLDLLARAQSSPLTTNDNSGIDVGFCGRLRADALSYELVIIDHGSGVSITSTSIALQSDTCLLVVVPELTSIADGYGLFKYLTEQKKQLDCRLLVNRAKSTNDADLIAEKLVLMTSKFLDISPKPIGWISDHPAVSESIEAQRPISQTAGKSIVNEQVGRIAGLLIKELRGRITGSVVINNDRSGDLVTLQTTINNSPATADIKG